MKRILRLLAVALVVAAMMVAMSMPAFAQGLGPSQCKEEVPGEFISDFAQNEGHSGDPDEHPGIFVPFGLGCNPHA